MKVFIKTLEKAAQLKIPAEKREIGTDLSVEFYGNESEQSTV